MAYQRRRCGISRVATVREKVWKMNFFPGQGKVREFGIESGKFEKGAEGQGNVREFQNFLKSDGLWQCINVLKELENVNSFSLKLYGFQFPRIS